MPKAASKPSLLDDVVETILRLNEPGGSTKVRLFNTISKATPSVTRPNLAKTLDKGVETSRLALVGSKYHVVGHAPPEPPAVKIEDIVVGAGALAESGAVTVSYSGTLSVGGKQFDASPKFSFELGVGEVIRGWDIGVKGMRVGGHRVLHVPSELAYGKRGAPPDIPPNSALTFDVKLLALK